MIFGYDLNKNKTMSNCYIQKYLKCVYKRNFELMVYEPFISICFCFFFMDEATHCSKTPINIVFLRAWKINGYHLGHTVPRVECSRMSKMNLIIVKYKTYSVFSFTFCIIYHEVVFFIDAMVMFSVKLFDLIV